MNPMDYKALYEQSQKENEILKEEIEQLENALESESKQHAEEMDCSNNLLEEIQQLEEELAKLKN